MSGMSDIMMIGLVGIMGYYVLASGVLTGQQTTEAPVTYTETPAPTALPTLETQCDTEGGKWQGSCCSCPNANCTEKCGTNDQYDEVDACESEDGLWQTNRQPQCCSCPNKECSRKCGSIKKTPSGCGGDDPDCNITESQKAAGICTSEGGDWKKIGNSGCCTCSGTCRNQCKSSAPTAPKKTTGGRPGKENITQNLTGKKPTYQNAGQFTYRTNYGSSSYLAGSSNRRGPSYTGRDDYRHYTNVEFPSPVDFEYESVSRPNWLGPVSQERHSLIRRFQSNFSSMRFSG